VRYLLPAEPVYDDYVPIIDLRVTRSPEGRSRVAAEVGDACRQVGFLVVTGHGVPGVLVGRMETVTRWLFEQPPEYRQRLSPASSDPMQRGYSERNGSLSPGTAPDLRWAFGINSMNEPGLGRQLDRLSPIRQDRYRYSNRWPDSPRLRAVWLDYFRAVEKLAFRLLALMAIDLGLPPGYFIESHSNAPSNLVANYYPAQEQPPADHQFRIGEHSDWGSITILYQDGQPGLEVYGRDKRWHLVRPTPGTFVINLGDMLEVWTGGLYASTRHRVLNPAREQALHPRLSVPWFGQPDDDAVIETPPELVARGAGKFGPVVSGDWFAQKLTAVRAPA
jgi:isopenicillin N synthase-like dioxygenase